MQENPLNHKSLSFIRTSKFSGRISGIQINISMAVLDKKLDSHTGISISDLSLHLQQNVNPLSQTQNWSLELL